MSIDFPKEEQYILQRWKEIRAFERQVELSKGKRPFTFYGRQDSWRGVALFIINGLTYDSRRPSIRYGHVNQSARRDSAE
jgi:hypothetical protein